ncbi:MAG: UvrD-helicase domain-containing protein [Prevotella sp.]|nr:UvrD-helicase domain-containing protein [Prevotella sp.]
MVTMTKPLTVYKASAGSGKTFTLAVEYISLLVENPLSYKNTLAVTFTNKATEEMKMRILSQLYGIWQQLPDSQDYFDAVAKKTQLDPALIAQRAGIALQNLLGNYNYFRVETIDTFFQSILRNMARELELTTNLKIGLNDTQVMEMAVDQLIADLTTQDVMLQWILKYIMENISDDRSWNVISQIKNFGRTLFKDDYKAVSKALETKMQEKGFFEAYTTHLRELRHAAEEQMKHIGDEFFSILEREGLTVEDLANKQRGIASFFKKLQNGTFDASIENKTVADCLSTPEKWYPKTSAHSELIHSLAIGELGDLLRLAVASRPQQWKLFKSADLTLKHLNQLRLLGSIERKVRQLNEDANRFLLSDTQQLLHSLIGESDSPFIFEKIGTQLEHVMIDEFQDTSTVQWKNFKVLLNEAMSHEGSTNLIVGDVKQSIYRWRAGDWRLLNDIEQQFHPEQIETQPLSTNYRSMPNVIRFNNRFFVHAANLEYLEQLELNTQEAEQLKRAYADVEQKIPANKKDGGYVKIELLPSEDYQAQVFEHMADTIAMLLDNGVRQQDIAILVRVNASIPLIAQYFMEQMPEVRIVSDEAFRLDASNAVNLMILALKLLVNPEDQLTKAAIVKTYVCDVKQQKISDNELFLATTNLDDLLPKDFTQHTSELFTLPLYDLAERLYAIFELEKLNDQSAYVCAFYDHLQNYVNDNTSDINAFLQEWDENLCSKTIQSDEAEGVRIFSIHKSKGLEYDHVIIPFCDWKLEKAYGNILWCNPSEAPFNDLPIAPIDYVQNQMMGTIYEQDYVHEHLQNTVDNLNLLYVAFTRACKSLFVIGKRNAGGTRSARIEQCLPLVKDDEYIHDAQLSGINEEDKPIVFEYGSLVSPASDKTKRQSQNPFLQKAEPIQVHVATFNNKTDFKQSNRSRDFVEGDDEENQQRRNYIQTGSVLHEVFSTIRTVDDIPEALRKLQLEGVLYDEHITSERVSEMLRKRLSHPMVAKWFSPKWTLFNECTILSIEDGHLKERRPDRVMTDGNEWIIVDFKFGSPKPEYTEQVKEYMALLSTMGHQHVKGYLWYVYSNRTEEIKH